MTAASPVSTPPTAGVHPRRFSPALYENAYTWLVLVSALDIMLTWIVLLLGGREVNGVAKWVIERFDVAGVVAFKFSIVVFVVGLCEIIGRRNSAAGRRLAIASVALTCVPVAFALYQLANHHPRTTVPPVPVGVMTPAHNQAITE